MKDPLAALTLLALIVSTHADPLSTGNGSQGRETTVTPESRAILERVARLYGGLKSLSVDLQTESTNVYKDKTIERRDHAIFQWDRRGLLRLNHTMNGSSIINGKRLWREQSRRFDSEPIEPNDKVAATLEEIRGSFRGGEVLIQLLQGQVPILSRPNDYLKIDVKLGPSASFEGTTCDVVEMELLTKSAGAISPIRHQYRLWIARKDGKLIRLRARMFGHHGDGSLDDTRLAHQRLNPVFGMVTFKIPMPKSRAALR